MSKTLASKPLPRRFCVCRVGADFFVIYDGRRWVAYGEHSGGDCEGCVGKRVGPTPFCPWCGWPQKSRQGARAMMKVMGDGRD